MAQVIHLLPDNIANQIAAGEVIQRPASVVKELIENAVDAGASKIELHIKDAGKTSIQLVDNGKGMSELDAQMAFERHATSKINQASDLFQLKTKGFRGEALASIAAIAHVSLETIEEGESVGTKLEIQGSKIKSKDPIARAKGSSFTVKNLFFNVPARRNFLKSNSVETKHIVEEFNRIALTHPEVHFIYSQDGKIIHQLEIAPLRKRIVELFGDKYNNRLVPIEESTDIVKISGFILKPEFAKKTRGEQYFFVNHRFFKNNYLNHSIINGYDKLILPNYYPSYFIYLEVPSETLDVNIHPTKTEVKFENNRSIYQILLSTTRLSLGKYNVAPTLDFEREAQFDLSAEEEKQPVKQPIIQVDPTYNPFSSDKKSPASSTYKKDNALRPNREEWENFYEITEENPTDVNNSSQLDYTAETIHAIKVQLHKKYLLVQVKNGILLIHISRANERLLYDQMMSHFMVSPIVSQQLMFPFEYHLQAQQKLEWKNNEGTIKRLGFNWEWKNDTLVFSGAPSIIEYEQLEETIEDITEKITHKEIDKGELVHELMVSLSSVAVNRKIQSLSDEEIDYLIEQLFQSEQHHYSPSGKKIMNTIPLADLKNYLK